MMYRISTVENYIGLVKIPVKWLNSEEYKTLEVEYFCMQCGSVVDCTHGGICSVVDCTYGGLFSVVYCTYGGLCSVVDCKYGGLCSVVYCTYGGLCSVVYCTYGGLFSGVLYIWYTVFQIGKR
jgi:hypothetical protein